MAKQKSHIPEGLIAGIRAIHPMEMTECLVQHLTAWMAQGLLQAGSQLPAERDLATKLHVSRTSVHQALKALEMMGVIEARHGSGTYLTEAAATIMQQPKALLMPLRNISFGELFEVRRMLEAEAAAVAATRATKRDVAALRREVQQMRRHIADPSTYLKHDMAFHRTIARATGNSIFAWFQELVVTVMRGALEARAQAVSIRETFAEHQAILRAIEARDPAAAHAAMLEHLVLTKFYQQEHTLVELRITASADAGDRAIPRHAVGHLGAGAEPKLPGARHPKGKFERPPTLRPVPVRSLRTKRR